jgi:DNA-binding CsgD family transcriptional regulator
MHRSPETAPPARRGPGRPPKVDARTLAKAARLVEEGGSLRSVAQDLGIARSTLSDHLGLGKGPGRKASLGAQECEYAAARKAAGVRVDDIAAELSVSPATVRRALARMTQSQDSGCSSAE